jgi:hypothetical protein
MSMIELRVYSIVTSQLVKPFCTRIAGQKEKTIRAGSYFFLRLQPSKTGCREIVFGIQSIEIGERTGRHVDSGLGCLQKGEAQKVR